MVYHETTFHSFCELAHRIPVVHVGGLAKRFLVPGWRLGWTIVHDPTNIFKNRLTIGIVKMSTRLGWFTLYAVQSSLIIFGHFYALCMLD